MFWGILLLAIGGSIVVQSVFGINLPLVRICLGVFLCYLGLNIVFGGFNINLKKKLTSTDVVFGKANFDWPTKKTNKDGKTTYTVVFAKGKLDLTNVDLSKGDVDVKLETVFGETVIILKPNTPYIISGDNVFSATKTPEGNATNFGKQNLRSDDLGNAGGNTLRIDADTVFGSLKVRYKEPETKDARTNINPEPSTI